MYRNGEHCNKCGALAPVPDSFYVVNRSFMGSKVGSAPVGRVWDKKKHKYVK
jgi:hypothetical protein